MSTYTYDHANRLSSVSQGADNYSYTHNGLGDRLSQTMNSAPTSYTLDLVGGLTQVLSDGTNVYLYGVGRLGELQPGGWEYHLPDALGSVRQRVDSGAGVMQAESYQPFGSVMVNTTTPISGYGFTGEWMDSYIKLIYLRSRYYAPQSGRFLTKDIWRGNYLRPQSITSYTYVENNPINFRDPSGAISEKEADQAEKILHYLSNTYNVSIVRDWGYQILSIPNAFYFGSNVKIDVCRWNEGNWGSIWELEISRDAVSRTAHKMGSARKFQAAFKSTIRIARWKIPESPAFAPPPVVNWILGGDIVLTDYHFGASNFREEYAKYNIVHELGHVWDIRSGLTLSRGMADALETVICGFVFGSQVCMFDAYSKEIPPGDSNGEAYASTNILEDWSEAFATYIYPDYYDKLKKAPIGPLRRQYVIDKIDSIP